MKGMMQRVCFLVAGPAALVMAFAAATPTFSQEADPQCASVKAKWELAIKELKEKLDDYEAAQRVPLERLVQRPLVERSIEKTIARQVSEAIEAKEAILSAKRKECLNMLNLEDQIYTDFEHCLQTGPRSKNKQDQQLISKRRSLVQKARISIAEVREVEGKDHFPQYVDTWRGPPGYGDRGVADYWQRMYQGYWGR